MSLETLSESVKALGTDVLDFAKNNPVLVSGVTAGAVGSAVLATTVIAKRKKRKSKPKPKTRKNKLRSKKRKSRTRKTPRTAGKRKDRSTKRIRYTKNGQPYVLKANGKARFISKKSAKMSRKRKGGRY